MLLIVCVLLLPVWHSFYGIRALRFVLDGNPINIVGLLSLFVSGPLEGKGGGGGKDEERGALTRQKLAHWTAQYQSSHVPTW